MTPIRRFSLTHWMRSALGWTALAGTAGLVAVLAYAWSERNGYARLDDTASRQLDLYASVLENELGKYDYLPRLLEIDSEIETLLRNPAQPALRATVNRRLTRFAVMSGVLSTFVLDVHGTVVAASDWYQPRSLVGQDHSHSAYFATAMRGAGARSFPPSALRGTSEYCFPQPVTRGDQVLGVAVACISLNPMEATWTGLAFPAESEKPFVVDAQGVIIVSSVPQWKFKVMAGMPAGRGGNRGPVLQPYQDTEPLGLTVERKLAHGALLVHLKNTAAGRELRGVLHELPIPRYGWRLLIVSDASEVWRAARNAAWGAGALTAFTGMLLLYLIQRRRVVAQKLAARAALQRAHDELEQKVQQRTAELQSANHDLRHEVLERKHAEEVLHEAQEELLQSGKMALLGQLSTGISHELGQPLTALRALTGNARQLLARGRMPEVQGNLDEIAELVERMGRITAQLKSFARKSSGSAADVSIAGAIEAARQLLQARIRDGGIGVSVCGAEGLRVQCDLSRLEQVLVNLMANAIDAMRVGTGKALDISVRQAAGRAVVRVADSGPGVPESMRQRLFEPFFTTKPAGEGLGLGLVISANIVQEFGGTLRAVDVARGAAFEFDLACAEADA